MLENSKLNDEIKLLNDKISREGLEGLKISPEELEALAKEYEELIWRSKCSRKVNWAKLDSLVITR